MRGNRGKVGRSKRGSMTTRPFKVLGIQQGRGRCRQQERASPPLGRHLGAHASRQLQERGRKRRRGHRDDGRRGFYRRGRPDAANRPRKEAPGRHPSSQSHRPVGRRHRRGGTVARRPGCEVYARRGFVREPPATACAFIHPKGSESAPIGGEGVLIELVEAPVEVREAFETISLASTPA